MAPRPSGCRLICITIFSGRRPGTRWRSLKDNSVDNIMGKLRSLSCSHNDPSGRVRTGKAYQEKMQAIA